MKLSVAFCFLLGCSLTTGQEVGVGGQEPKHHAPPAWGETRQDGGSRANPRGGGNGGGGNNGNGGNGDGGDGNEGNNYNCDEGCGLDEVGHGPPVCGADGNTYFNECLAVCQDVEVTKKGACPGNPNKDFSSYIKEGKVSRADMDAFKDKSFKLLAKRDPDAGVVHEPESDEADDDGAGETHVKARLLTRDGLEYGADYDINDIPTGEEYMPSDEVMPPENRRSLRGGGKLDELDKEDAERLLSVIGADTRTETYYSTWPNWRLVMLDYASGSFCSGAVIGPNKVLTAAHCVYDTSAGAWKMPSKVAPGRSNGGFDPYGTWNVLSASVYAGWIDGKGWEYDIAVLTIANTGSWIQMPIGKYVGWLGMKVQPCSFSESSYRITGYPGDKPYKTMWTTGVCDDWYYSCGSRKIYHQCDTYGGMSGSAIRNEYQQITAVHAYGGSGWNSGTAINQWHLNNIQYW